MFSHHTLQAFQQQPHQRKQQQQQQQPASHLGPSRLAAALTNGGKSSSSSAPSVDQTSLSLINSQSVVNIAGHKYLIVPHPDPIAPAKYQGGNSTRFARLHAQCVPHIIQRSATSDF